MTAFISCNWSLSWLISPHIDWLIDWLIDLLIGRLNDFSSDRLIDCFAAPLIFFRWQTLKAFLPHMMDQNHGHIVTVASIVGKGAGGQSVRVYLQQIRRGGIARGHGNGTARSTKNRHQHDTGLSRARGYGTLWGSAISVTFSALTKVFLEI